MRFDILVIVVIPTMYSPLILIYMYCYGNKYIYVQQGSVLVFETKNIMGQYNEYKAVEVKLLPIFFKIFYKMFVVAKTGLMELLSLNE